MIKKSALCAVLTTLIFITLVINNSPYILGYDEGIILVGSLLVRQGYIPYSDFWTMYSPGSFYLNALLFSILGEERIIPQFIGSLFMAGTLSLVYVIQKDRWLPLRVVGLLAGLGFMLHVGQEQFPGFQALFFSICSMYVLSISESTPGALLSRRLFTSGVLCGMAAVFDMTQGDTSTYP